MNESYNLSHLKELEAESIHIIREVAAEFENPVMLYSIGKDSSVMVRLAEKAFYPGKVPFPLMHIDSKWKFKEMIQFRDEYAKKYGWNLILDKGCTAHVMSRVKDGTSYKICIAGISEETLNESRGGNRFSPVHDGEMIVEAGSEAVKGAKSAAGTDDAFTVLLAHEPQFISDYAKCGADLIACGHAHGGQIRIPGTDMGLFAPEQGVLPKYTSGIYDCGKAKMAVSRGLGNSLFPQRILNRPEIVVETLLCG